MASKRPGMRNKDVRAGVASGSRLVAVELAGLQENAASGGLVVVMSRGRRIEVSRWFDAATLERLLAVNGEVCKKRKEICKKENKALTGPTFLEMSDFIFGRTEPRFYGLIARHHQNKTDFVLAIRGTEGHVEWWDDASFHLVPFSQVLHAGRVAHDFDKIYSTLKVVQHPRTLGTDQKALDAQELVGSFGDQLEQLQKRLEHAANRAENPAKHRPDRPCVVTDHSLGAALSTLFVIENKEKQKFDIATSCTFASPRVGNVQFGIAFNELPITSWRIVNSYDIVPRLPFRIPGILDFEHVNTEYRYSSGGEVKFSPVCWHEMQTYLHLLDPEQPLDVNCAVPLEPAQGP